eukprot:GDKK01002480.1.p1 GENE.GDKK01002480.1~~GDKK01002480.1.p1  ORF type:complete len:225 (+),score=46.47 GDKK01002480.1:36-677(+)
MSVALNATSAILSLTSFTFYFIGVIGYTVREETVKNVNWFHVFQRNGVHVYAGLRALYYEPGSGSATVQLIYGNDQCNQTFCDRCEKTGDIAFGLLVVALIMSFITLLLSISGTFAPSTSISGANIGTSLTSVIFAVIGFGFFTHGCYPKLQNTVNTDWDYGPGAIFTLIAFLLTFIVAVLQVVATALSPKADVASPVPVKSEAVSTNEPNEL